MKRRHLFVLPLLMLAVLVACNDEDAQSTNVSNRSSGLASYSEKAGFADAMLLSAPAPEGAGAGSLALDRSRFGDRRIAESHNMDVEVDGALLHARVKADLSFCLSLKCEVLNSSYHENMASLSVRIVPEDLPKFLDSVEKAAGKLTGHSVSADDRTTNYVDLAARLKNKEALRERLTQMLTTKSDAKLGDIIQLEREIARVQEELDSATGKMRLLENETAKARVNVSYTVPVYARPIKYNLLKGSFSRAWSGFISNLGGAIEFTGNALPWIPILLIGLWLIIRILKAAIFGKSGKPFWRRKEKTEEPV